MKKLSLNTFILFNLKYLKVKELLFLLLLISVSYSLKATSTNLGFENGFTDWTQSGTTWLTNNSAAYLRSGTTSIRLNTSSTNYRKIYNSLLTKTVNDNISKFVTFSVFVKSNQATSKIQLGVFDTNLGIEILQSGTSTATIGGFTQISFTTIGLVGHTYYPVLYAANSIAGSINIYFDDASFFISSFSLVDNISPTKPTTLSAVCATTNITLNFLSGLDSESGISGVLILRKAGVFSDNPVAVNQLMYSSTSSLDGPISISGYKVVYNDTLISSFTDNPGLTGKYTYLIYMRDKAGNYTSSSSVGRIWVFNGTGLNNTVFINSELDGLYLPATCFLTINSTSVVTVRNAANIHIYGTILDKGSFQNVLGGSLTFESASGYQYNRNGNSMCPIVNANWSSNSSCVIAGITTVAPTGTNQTFGKFQWICGSQTTDVDLDPSFGTSGTFIISNCGNPAKTIWLNGMTQIKGDIIRTSGFLNYRANSNVILDGTTLQNINISTTFHKLTINNSAGVKLMKTITIDSTIFLNDGVFNLNSNNLKIAIGSTLSRGNGFLSGNPAFLGIYNLIYTSPLTTGYELTSALTKLQNLNINSGGVVTLSKNANVNGSLTFINGIINTNSFEVRTYNSNIGSITGYSAISYIDGILNRVVSSSGIYDFPVGTSSNYELISINLVSAIGVTNIRGFFNQANPGIVPSGLQINGSDVLGLLDYGYWTLTPNIPLAGGTYDVTCNMKGQSNGPSTATMYGIVKREDNSMPWQSLGTHSNSTQTISGGVVTAKRSSLSSFSDFVIGFGGVSLPIVLSSFEVTPINKNDVQIKWTTESELNFDYFELQKSHDGISFYKVTKVISEGTNVHTKNYSFIDDSPFEGINYYRLKEVDLNGKENYSVIKSIDIQNHDNHFEIYPNPANQSIFIEGLINSDNYTIEIINISGQIIFQNKFELEELNPLKIDIKSLNPGIYFLTVFSEKAQKASFKFIKE